MLYLIIATVCFSLSFGLIKSQLSGVPSDFVVELRLILAGLVFLPFFKRLSFKKCFTAAIVGIIEFGLMYVFFIRAFKYLQGNEIALLTTTTPIFVAICTSFFGSKFNRLYIFSIILSVIGAIIVIWDNVSFNFLLKGVILMELSNFCFALGQVLWRRFLGESSLSLMVPAYFAAALVVLPLAFINIDLAKLNLGVSQWLSILYLGIVPTGIGFWLWNIGARQVNALTLSVMNNLKIPMGVFLAIVLFQEQVNLINFSIGSLLIVLAIYLGNNLQKNR